MAESAQIENEDEEDAPEKETDGAEERGEGTARDEELATNEEYADDLNKIRDAVEKCFGDQVERTNEQQDYWDIYDCVLNDNQAYDGNSQAYVSLTADAVDARQIRFTNQLFPANGRYVEVITQDGEMPDAEMALVEHYIESLKLKTNIVTPLCKNGDIEGQYNLYVGWNAHARHVIKRSFRKVDDKTEIEEVTEEEILDEGPLVECLADADVVIFPSTANTVDEALAKGGGVGITRRWSKARIEQMMDDGEIEEEAGQTMLDSMTTAGGSAITGQSTDMNKEHVSATGIKQKGSWYLGREVWHMLEVDGVRRIVRSYFGSQADALLGTKLNPYWNDKVPVLSASVKKISGAMKGQSLLKRVASLQYLANDFLNQAADSATYAMLPIVMTDPNSNPKTSTMILDLAAVWEVDPEKTKFASFPHLWEQGFELISALKAQIQQSLGVNPSMMPSTSGKSKRSQADIANEQAVDLLTTADSVTVLEEGILTPLVQWIVDLDQQFRVEDLMIPKYGMMGKRAKMERIPPLQMGNRLYFKWLGVQAARNAQQIQQQVSAANVIAKIPPQMYKNHRMDLTAMIENIVENAFGPRLAPLTFVSLKDELSMDPQEENELLMQGMPVRISPMDDDQKHIQVHSELIAADTTGFVKFHIAAHQQSMQAKAMAAQQQAAAQAGGGPPGQIQPGAPRPGAQSQAPRGGQQPAGAMHQDRMAQAGAMPIQR